jgi:signal transduction histidine kinase
MRRLYLQIYLAFIAILFVFAALAAAIWHLREPRAEDQQMLDDMAALVADRLPSGSAAEQQASLRALASRVRLNLTLWGEDGQVLAAVGERLPFPGRERTQSGWMPARGGPIGFLRLPDGRWLAARPPHPRVAHGALLVFLTVLAVAVFIGAYPVARRLTRRLERLRMGVEGLGAGDFHARVPVEGRDEVAVLARSFNRAADRIEALVGAQRTLLASASHELRSPLARIRVALELMGAGRPDLRDPVARDIAELDDLIGELLLASRLETVEQLEHSEEVDLLGLVAEEAARSQAAVSGQAVTVWGDARLLRRLVRNLLENAVRHGAAPVEAFVEAADGRARLRVCDRGPGVPEPERERIFAPFYRPSSRPPGEAGSGLGLALVRQIARRHGGEARYVPREDGGTCFEVELPARGEKRA